MLFMFVFSMVSSCKVIHFIFFWSMVILRTTDGGSVTWYEPPPVETTSHHNIELTADSRQFLEGSTLVQLSWNFSLTPDLSLNSVSLDLNGVQVAGVLSSGIAGALPGFEGRFNITWISQSATLIIFNVTEEGDGVFGCGLSTYQGLATKVWKRKMKVEVVVETSFTGSPSGDQTVSEGSNLTLFCDATGKPTPNVTWTRVLKNGTDGDVVFFGNPWVIVNISRTVTGTYRCTAYNGIGNPVNHSLYINVTYHPDNVTLVTNSTENKDCSDLWVNFTCFSSEANPPVYNYLLSDDKDGFGFSTRGTWIEKISRGGIFNCKAYQLVENVTSTNEIALTVNVPLAMEQAENETVQEGDNVELYCNVTAGIPDPTVIWTKVQGGGYNPTEGKLLNITNITRAQAGEYRCTANNTCGEKSTVTSIDVQYGPENVILTTNTTSKVCTGVVINFTCTAEANPPVHTYLLYQNNTVINDMGISGTWIKTMENAGKFVFRCEANNSIQGSGTSNDTVLTIEVPASVEQVENKDVTEGDNVEVNCSVTAGFPRPTVMWTNVTSGEHIKGNPLNITNINRAQAGEYRCTANNTCGEDSTVMSINVQYKPENVRLITNTTSKACRGVVINFTCTAEANPPVHTYLLYENDTAIANMGISGTWVKTMENAGQFVFRCEANNSIREIGKSGNTILTVDVPASVEQAENKVVKEGDNVELYCNVTAGIPRPAVTWTNVTSDKHIEGNSLNITNINRAQDGEYRCTASNTCGEDSTVVDINVHYPPMDTGENHTIDVPERDSASIYCPVLGNPHPIITWYKGNDTSSGIVISTTNPLEFLETVFNHSGWYTCFAENYLGNVTVTVQLRVVVETPSTPITSSEPMTKDPGVRDSEVNATAKIRNVRYKKELANMSSDDSRNLTSRIKRGVSEVYQKADDYKDIYSDTRVNKFENGSVVVFFTIIFNKVVHIDDAILVLKNASENGTLGDLKIEPGSIKALLPVATTPATTSPKETATTNPTSDHEKDNDLWIIIGASVGGVIVLAIVVAVVAWCVHHKRKCRRKGSKVRCSESEAFAPGEDNGSGHVNNGYADAGPRPTAMEDMSQHQGASAVPTYAVVDKSAKKGSKKDKVEEQKPQAEAPQYAAVDKSKKKKKEEPEATYAQVDKSKKSKKKPKPGEVLYADLGDFQQMQELPRVSTSPQALPPIKKPTTYVETQYADITQFLKGDVTLPDSNNSQGPATGSKAAPAPENSNSQEPGTNTKETSRASNAGGDGGPGHETNF